MQELDGVIRRFQVQAPPSRKMVLLCPNQAMAGQMQVEAGELFRQHGATPVGPGTWELYGAIFQFLSAQGDLQLIRQQLQGAAVMLLTDPDDMDRNPYLVAILRQLMARGQAFMVVPRR